ncbi:Peptidyl-prolyl cis-trans isomerase FKBP8 [Strongyloides ratti]|uniref:peptidylprolyl isomerase n=1 Tax=Strongyloides ratti TaxID=34506 RepID=A0A090LCJ2_STRRB|nr:Peptidyl-prolyl cis-trans isomerase FKBP8 [Strongyloides ratti]CEF65838.1 Peptidyl-prolyl cis-trans isomerase FKBP8 [Strongyloides ratti]
MNNLTLNNNINDTDLNEPYEDVIGTGVLLKKVINEGNNIKPVDGDIIKIILIYHGLNNSHSEEITFTLGYLLNTEGIELACKYMDVGETAIFKIKSHLAYGEIGLLENSCIIPPNHDLIVQIHLISIEGHQKLLLDDTPIDEILENFKIFRKKGKFYFQRGELDRAMFIYNKLLHILDEITINRFDKLLLIEMSILQNNLAVCYYKLKDHTNALKMSTAAVSTNPENVNIIYKHLIILKDLRLYEKAITLIEKSMINLPSEKMELEKRFNQFIKYKKKVDDDQREFYRKMMR